MESEELESKIDPLHEHREACKRFREAWKSNRDRYIDDVKFLAGDQWFPENKTNREKNGQPCLVIDKLSQYVRQVVNDSRQNRPAIKIRPEDSFADPDTAEVFQGLIRHIESRSNADTSYDTALECAAKGGFGFIRVLNEYADEDTFEQELCIKRIRNPLTVLFDPDCQEADGSDAKRVFIEEQIKKEDFESQYPDADPVDWENDHIKFGDWIGEDKITIAEAYWVEQEEVEVHLLTDGTTAEQSEIDRAIAEGVTPPKIKDTRKIKRNKVKWAKINGKQYLEGPTDIPCQWIPVIPVWGNETDIEGEVSYTGMFFTAKDSQRLYNYSRSAYAERVALTPKAPYIAASGQVERYEEWETANQESHSVLRYDPQDIAGTPVPPPMRQPAADIPAGFAQDMQISEHDIQSALGMYNASLGAQSNEKSGRAIMARQREGDVATFHYHDNLARAIRQCGRILVDMIPSIYDTNRTVRILGIDGSQELVQLDPMQKAAKAQRGKQTIYNLGVGRYDVTVTVGPSYTTRRQEAAEAMVQMVQGNPQLMGIVGDLMVKSMDWPGADEIADRLKLLLPPEVRQMEQQDQEQSPEVMMIMQQAQQAIGEREAMLQQAGEQIQQLTQQLADLEQAVKDKSLDAQISAQELQIKQQETAIKAFDAETDRLELIAKTETEREDKANALEPINQIMAQIQELGSVIENSKAENLGIIQQVMESMRPKAKVTRSERLPDGSYKIESIDEEGNEETTVAKRQPDGSFVMGMEQLERAE